jgi:hypothetical protein
MTESGVRHVWSIEWHLRSHEPATNKREAELLVFLASALSTK